MNDSATLAFADLQPEDILATLTELGFACDGRFLALNSYENRVYQVGIEDKPPIVAKFYRPGRWSDDAILEEHAFAADLHAQEIPVVPPLEHQGETLHHSGHQHNRTATVYPHPSHLSIKDDIKNRFQSTDLAIFLCTLDKSEHLCYTGLGWVGDVLVRHWLA